MAGWSRSLHRKQWGCRTPGIYDPSDLQVGVIGREGRNSLPRSLWIIIKWLYYLLASSRSWAQSIDSNDLCPAPDRQTLLWSWNHHHHHYYYESSGCTQPWAAGNITCKRLRSGCHGQWGPTVWRRPKWAGTTWNCEEVCGSFDLAQQCTMILAALSLVWMAQSSVWYLNFYLFYLVLERL